MTAGYTHRCRRCGHGFYTDSHVVIGRNCPKSGHTLPHDLEPIPSSVQNGGQAEATRVDAFGVVEEPT